jgi:hypothetical protein
MTASSTTSAAWALPPRQRTKSRAPALRLALSAGRALLVALIVGQLGVALVSVLRTQANQLQKDLATTTELVP